MELIDGIIEAGNAWAGGAAEWWRQAGPQHVNTVITRLREYQDSDDPVNAAIALFAGVGLAVACKIADGPK